MKSQSVAIIHAIVSGLLILSLPQSARAELQIPNGSLSIAYRRRHGITESKELYQLELKCTNNKCSLITMTIHGCSQTLGGCAPTTLFINYSEDGHLTVKPIAENILQVSRTDEVSESTYRFEYTVLDQPDIQREQGGIHSIYFYNLISFSGSYYTDTELPDQIARWEIVPLRNGRYSVVPLECSLCLPGLIK